MFNKEKTKETRKTIMYNLLKKSEIILCETKDREQNSNKTTFVRKVMNSA